MVSIVKFLSKAIILKFFVIFFLATSCSDNMPFILDKDNDNLKRQDVKRVEAFDNIKNEAVSLEKESRFINTANISENKSQTIVFSQDFLEVDTYGDEDHSSKPAKKDHSSDENNNDELGVSEKTPPPSINVDILDEALDAVTEVVTHQESASQPEESFVQHDYQTTQPSEPVVIPTPPVLPIPTIEDSLPAEGSSSAEGSNEQLKVDELKPKLANFVILSNPTNSIDPPVLPPISSSDVVPVPEAIEVSSQNQQEQQAVQEDINSSGGESGSSEGQEEVFGGSDINYSVETVEEVVEFTEFNKIAESMEAAEDQELAEIDESVEDKESAEFSTPEEAIESTETIQDAVLDASMEVKDDELVADDDSELPQPSTLHQETELSEDDLADLDVVWVIENSKSLYEQGFFLKAMSAFAYYLANILNQGLNHNVTLVTASSSDQDNCSLDVAKDAIYDFADHVSNIVEVAKDLLIKFRHVNCVVGDMSAVLTMNALFERGKLLNTDYNEIFSQATKKAIIVVSDSFSLNFHAKDFTHLVDSNLSNNLVDFYSISSESLPQSETINTSGDLLTADFDHHVEPYSKTQCGRLYTASFHHLTEYYNSKKFSVCSDSYKPAVDHIFDF